MVDKGKRVDALHTEIHTCSNARYKTLSVRYSKLIFALIYFLHDSIFNCTVTHLSLKLLLNLLKSTGTSAYISASILLCDTLMML